jgi:TonB family protein
MTVADQGGGDRGIPCQIGLTVRLLPEFTNTLSTALRSVPSSEPQPTSEQAGLLFGTIEKDLITVRAFRSFALWDSRQDSSATADPEMSGLELIGWCCVRHGSMGLLPRVVQFHNRHFPRATDLMLILNAEPPGLLIEVFGRSSTAPLSMQHFRCRSFQLCAETPVTQPIELKLEEKSGGDDLASPQPATSVTSIAPANTVALLPVAPLPRTNQLLWVISAALFVLAAGMALAWAHTRGQYVALARESRSVISPNAPTSGLRMQAEASGDGALLSWNHNAPAVRSAKQGILHIHDGSEEHRIYLDPTDLMNGSIVYKPQSSGAKFRLELLGEHGSPLSNDVQTFDGTKSTIGSPAYKTAVPLVGVPEVLPANGEPHQSAFQAAAGLALPPETLPNYIPARVLKQVLPDTKLFAVSDIREGAAVYVQVRIDQNGGVIEAHVKNGTNDNGSLRSAALEAAKQWIFEPAKIGGKNIPSDHTIAFQFHS